ncbi:MAG: hypothetical protein IK118_09975 [Clostridia bacterium]|nr:hypothetical protein [Clostridia bacterium]
MKKTIALLLAALLLLSLTACSGGSGKKTDNGITTTEEPTEPVVLTAADDTQVMDLCFTAPQEYETVERYTDLDANGGLLEKDLVYSLADGGSITYAYMKGQDLSTIMDTSELETREAGGQSFMITERSGNYLAFAQKAEDLYAVSYAPGEGGDGSLLDTLLAQVSFTDATETSIDDIDLYDIRYTIDENLHIAGTSIKLLSTPDGTVTKKSVFWNYGESDDSVDFTLMVRVFKNATMASVLSEEKEYEQKTVSELEYTVLKTDDDTPYEYYTQHGDDVYEIRNNGKSGWTTTRSDESIAAFEAFLNSVGF